MRIQDLLLAAAATFTACSHAPAPRGGQGRGESLPVVSGSFVARVSGQGRPVIFVPDLGVSSEVWRSTLEHLAGRVQAHVLDIAGFAGSAPVAGPLLPRLRAELASYIRERRLDRPVVVGHVFGAAVAYWLAMTEPELLGGVIAIDAPPSRATGDVEAEAEARQGAKALAEAPPERFAQMLTRRLASSMKDQVQAERLARTLVRSDPAVISEAFLDMMTRDLRGAISRIRAPVLVVLTTGNLPAEAVPAVEGMIREQLAPVARHEVVLVPQSRHYVMFDAPQVFFEQLDRFLGLVLPPSGGR